MKEALLYSLTDPDPTTCVPKLREGSENEHCHDEPQKACGRNWKPAEDRKGGTRVKYPVILWLNLNLTPMNLLNLWPGAMWDMHLSRLGTAHPALEGQHTPHQGSDKECQPFRPGKYGGGRSNEKESGWMLWVRVAPWGEMPTHNPISHGCALKF